MAGNSAKIRVEFIGKDRSLGATFASTWRKADTLSKKLTLVAGGMQSFGRSATKFLTLPLLAIGALSVKAAASFDQAMTTSTAIMGDVSAKLRKEMEDTARTVAKTTTFSHEEAAKSYYYLASAGLSAQQSIKAMPAVAKFAQAGAFDMARATDLLTDAQSALGLQVKDTTQNLTNMTRVSDVLVRAEVLANASTEQFSEALTNKAGAALRLLHKDVEEGAAVLAVYANQGLKGAAAGTALMMVLRDLQKASLKQPEVWKKMGVAVYDSGGNMRNVADIIGDLEGAFEGLSDKQVRARLTAMGFTDKSIAATQSLLGQSEAIRDYEKKLRSAGGTTDEVAKKQLEAFSAKLELLKSKFVDIGITIGTELMPHLEAFAGWLSKGADWFGDLSEGTQRWILKLGVALAAVGPLSYVMGSTIKVALALAKAYKAIAIWAGAASLAEKGVGAGGLGKVGKAGLAGRGLASAAGGAGLAGVAAGVVVPVAIVAGGAALGYAIGKALQKLDTVKGGNKPGNTFGTRNRVPAGELDLSTQKATDELEKWEAKWRALRERLSERLAMGDLDNKRLLERIDEAQEKVDYFRHITHLPLAASHLKNTKWLTPIEQAKQKRDYFASLVKQPIAAGHLNNSGLITPLQQALAYFKTVKWTIENTPISSHATITKSVRTIKAHAYGGIVTRPQIGLIGEAGPEAVIPLTRPARARQVMQEAGLAGGFGTINVNVVVPGGTTLIGTAREVGEIIAPHVARALDRAAARGGRRR